MPEIEQRTTKYGVTVKVGDRIRIFRSGGGDPTYSERTVVGFSSQHRNAPRYYRGDNRLYGRYTVLEDGFEVIVDEVEVDGVRWNVGEKVQVEGYSTPEEIKFLRINCEDKGVYLADKVQGYFPFVTFDKLTKITPLTEDDKRRELKDMPHFYLALQRYPKYEYADFKTVLQIITELFKRSEKPRIRGFMLEWIDACPTKGLKEWLDKILSENA